MITIFAMPKPFRGRFDTIQRNAIASWVKLHPKCQVILFGDEEGTRQVAQEFGICHMPEVDRNKYGTPLLNDVFEKAEQLAQHNLLCYANCDIILMSDFIQAMDNLSLHRDRFLMIGQCWNLDLIEPLSFDRPDWETCLRSLVSKQGKLRGPWALDYFAFPRGFYGSIPPFALGRAYFDNWLVWKARALKSVLVDATRVVTAIHQNHDYSHVSGGRSWVYSGEEARINLELAQGHIANTFDATHWLSPAGLKPNLRGRFPFRFLRHTGRPIGRLMARWWLAWLALTRPMRHLIGLRMTNIERLKSLLTRQR